MKIKNNIVVNDASIEYNIKAKKNNDIVNVKITSSQICYDYIKQLYDEDINIYESSYIVLLNQQMKTKGWVKISQGGIAGTVVDIRLIAYCAIKTLATGVILVHNHPSGNLTFSDVDINLSKKIKNGLYILEINFVDSMVITENGYISAADEGII